MKIVIDAGHGGKDPGAIGNGLQEKDLTLSISKKISAELRRHNIEVIETRKDDSYVTLKQRTDLANNSFADYFVSIHVNAFPDIAINGLETYYYLDSTTGKAFATNVHNEVWAAGIFRFDRKIKYDNFHVLRETNMPAILAELGFITNKEDSDVLKARETDIVEALVKGILKHIGYSEPPIEEPKEYDLYRVQVGAFQVKENADALLKKLKRSGFEGFIVKERIQIQKPGKPPPIVKPLSEYYEMHGLKVIETEPDNVYVATLPGKNLRQFGIYGINGTWQDNQNAASPVSIWGVAGNKNKAIGPNSYQNSPKGRKKGTLVYYEDGTLEVVRINNIKELTKPFKWCIGGGSLIPNYNPLEEGIADDILRNTDHTGIGFKDNRIFMFVTMNYCPLLEFKTRAQKLNLEQAIFLDGGISSQMNYKNNKGLYSSRPLSHGVFLKEV